MCESSRITWGIVQFRRRLGTPSSIVHGLPNCFSVWEISHSTLIRMPRREAQHGHGGMPTLPPGHDSGQGIRRGPGAVYGVVLLRLHSCSSCLGDRYARTACLMQADFTGAFSKRSIVVVAPVIPAPTFPKLCCVLTRKTLPGGSCTAIR